MEINNVSLNSDDFYSYYTSAPTSPRRYNQNSFFFLSMPTSPTRDPLGSNFGSRTLDLTEDFLKLVDNFEFEGSKRFYPYENGQEKSPELSMVYADDLFFNGKMLPLKPPPRTHYTRSENCSNASSPGTRNSMIKVPFLRQRSLWNDGFDPFTIALNKVKEDNSVRKSLDKGKLRRAKSLSPLRLAHGSTKWVTTNEHNKFGPSPEKRMTDIAAWKKEHGPENKDVFGPILESKENMRKKRIKQFLLKNATFEKSEKKEQNVPMLLRKLHYSVKFRSATTKTLVRISKEMKSLMKNRAKIILCLAKGLGPKCTRKLG